MFIKSFDEEIELLEKTNLPNKLQLFSLYEELYKFLITSILDNNLKLDYSDFLTNTFINIINIINNLNKDSNINTIMKEFIRRIKLNNYSNTNPLITYINMFEYNLDRILKVITEASIIDNTNYSFKIKVILLEIYKNYIESIIFNLNKFYDINNIKLFGLKVMNELKNKLESILNEDINYFKEFLVLEIKNIFLNSYHNKEFDFFNFKNNISNDIVYALDDLEKELFIDIIIDIVIDFDDSEFFEKNNSIYFRELASKYNVSINEIIDKLEAVNLKIGEFQIEEPKLIL